ncbi:Sir2 family NAD-dependent protein deacetylase [Aequorivita sp. KMM 9714]|uniref:SIR2 family NAD-dependent protein deacylase n=1 Tax=Aequorivita sp. KMM 9714 TaxID=2707173 RepID=UPI0013ED3CB0|nr:Sir2 family NAD-dependent protein deacetylase [Aequorivita sp. KMM 9714]NGX85261.1 NAD-dependent deacylase [Aequorivita sp. KMM 9714]
MKHKHHIVFFTGAGISKESGIPTFRDNNGLWSNHKLEEVASIDGFNKNPQLVLDFYNERRREVEIAQPNLAHKLIAELEDRYEVSVITQNVDNLHERAGSTNVLHLHGELTKCRSIKDKNLIYSYTKDIQLGDLAADGGQLRPHIVWFGEEVAEIEKAIAIAETADLFVIVGTSMVVQPAGSLLLSVPVDAQTVYIDIKPDVQEGINLLVLQEKATTGVKLLVEEYLP